MNAKKFAGKLFATAALAMAGIMAQAETYAVCIGINDYPEVKDENGKVVDNDLKGCVNDAKAIKDSLVKKFGVKEANVKLLLDKQANLNSFLEQVKWLAANAKAGDQVVLMYSGHGAQLKDEKEPDGFEEVIVLADENLIPGDFFGELGRLLNVNGINATFIFDSCYSGGMSRDVDGKIQVRNKSLGVVKAKSARSMADVQTKLATVTPKQIRTRSANVGESVFLFASQEGKTSSDISGMKDIEPHGLFTLLMLAVLEDEPKTPIKDLYDVVNLILADLNKKLKDQGADKQFDQGPNFESTAIRAGKPIIL